MSWVVFLLLLFVAYYVLSTLALLLCVCRSKPRRHHFTHCAHRGGSAERWENTLSAFDHAVAVGCTHLELDVYLTADKQVVVNHDYTLHRMTGVDVDVRAVAYKDLPPIVKNPQLPFPFFHPSQRLGDIKGTTQQESDGGRFPLLEEVLLRYRDFGAGGDNGKSNQEEDGKRAGSGGSSASSCSRITVNIDLKHDSDELITRVHEIVARTQMRDRVVWGNFSDRVCRKLYKLDPGVPLLVSAKRLCIILLQYYLGILPLCAVHESNFQIPMITPEFAKHVLESREPQSRFKRVISRVILRVADHVLAQRLLFRHLQRRGVHVMLWVLNTESDFDRAFRQLGVDSVCTDRPSLLTAYLSRTQGGGAAAAAFASAK